MPGDDWADRINAENRRRYERLFGPKINFAEELERMIREAKEAEAAVCSGWPNCPCGEAWDFWSDELKRVREDATRQELGWAATSLLKMLGCVGERCPDPEFRAAARKQAKLIEAIREREGV
jgi:hypothetical protein